MLTENKFSKYLIYAIGEIVLVVIGILIALQINNWNQNKLEETALAAYLNSISKNIKTDIKNLEFVKTNRTNAISRVPHLIEAIHSSDYLERTDIKYASETINIISDFEYFNADLSGFESIKNSGYLRNLQGQDIENLLYQYYNLVQEIIIKERDYNEILRNAYSDFSSKGFENIIYLTSPDYIGDRNQLTSLQPYLKEIIFNPSAIALYNQTFYKAPALIIDYDNLHIIGKELVRMIENNQKDFDNISTQNLHDIYNPNDKIGYPEVIVNGAANSKFFDIGYASAGDNKYFKIISGINEIIYEVPKIDWAVAYYRNPSNAMVERPTMDYSSYKSIKLELKGEKGGETVFITLKDNLDPDDGTETKVPLILTNEYKTYEIPLSEFKTANLKELFIVASLVFMEEAIKVHLRSVEYVK